MESKMSDDIPASLGRVRGSQSKISPPLKLKGNPSSFPDRILQRMRWRTTGVFGGINNGSHDNELGVNTDLSLNSVFKPMQTSNGWFYPTAATANTSYTVDGWDVFARLFRSYVVHGCEWQVHIRVTEASNDPLLANTFVAVVVTSDNVTNAAGGASIGFCADYKIINDQTLMAWRDQQLERGAAGASSTGNYDDTNTYYNMQSRRMGTGSTIISNVIPSYTWELKSTTTTVAQHTEAAKSSSFTHYPKDHVFRGYHPFVLDSNTDPTKDSSYSIYTAGEGVFNMTSTMKSSPPDQVYLRIGGYTDPLVTGGTSLASNTRYFPSMEITVELCYLTEFFGPKGVVYPSPTSSDQGDDGKTDANGVPYEIEEPPTYFAQTDVGQALLSELASELQPFFLSTDHDTLDGQIQDSYMADDTDNVAAAVLEGLRGLASSSSMPYARAGTFMADLTSNVSTAVGSDGTVAARLLAATPSVVATFP